MKWKLIKTYPLCPFELGIIATDENVKSENLLSIRRGVGEYTVYPKDAIVNNPEFWEEVKEKEYTILSFKSNDCDAIFDKQHNDTYVNTCVAHSLEDCLRYDTFKIHSVRRESDKQTFILGDNITDRISEGVIKEFEIGEHILGGMYACIGEGKKISINLIRFLPKRKPILITEDGVEVFDGDDYLLFSVLAKATWEERRTPVNNLLKAMIPEWKHFHTKEAREEYIKWNKPLYSLNDVKEALFDSVNENHTLDVLEKLVK